MSNLIELYATVFLLLLAVVGGLALLFALMATLADWLEQRWPSRW